MVDAGRPVPAAGRSGGSGQAGAGSSPRGRDARLAGMVLHFDEAHAEERPRLVPLTAIAYNAPPIPARLQVPRRAPLFPS